MSLLTKAKAALSISLRTARDLVHLTSRPTQRGIAMLHVGRCGSGVLARMLAQHTKINWKGEVFKKDELPRHLQLMPPKYALRILAAQSKKPMYGFETKHHHHSHLSKDYLDLSLEQYLNQLSAVGIDTFIELRRDNYLRRVVSSAVASKKDNYRYHHPKDAPPPKKVRVKIDPGNGPFWGPPRSLITIFEELDALHEKTLHLLKEHSFLRLSYEKHIEEDPRIAYKEVCAFLEVEAEPVDITLRRTNPYPMAEIVINWREIQDYLTDTPYECMLQDKKGHLVPE